MLESPNLASRDGAHMQPNEISIKWQLNLDFAPPRTWYRWDNPQLAQALAATDAQLDSRLAWPIGTSGILLAALANGLPRSTGWECDTQDAPAATAALACAAKFYKRGVAWRSGAQTEDHSSAATGHYSITIHPSSIDAHRLLQDSEFLVIDGNVLRHWPNLANTSQCLAMHLSEHEKTLSTVALILETWRRLGQAKTWTVVGGGLLADVAAFAASLVDCNLRLIPTTLLAMADACVGGKTGVNQAPFGKNQIGSFYFPQAVDVWTGWLATLPLRELRAGAAECLKHAFLCGDSQLAQQIAEATTRHDLRTLSALLPRIIKVKADLVSADPGETGLRAILNFGHTLAHALEAMAHDRTTGDTTILHGEAVGVGLAYALLLSHLQINLDATELDAMLSALRHAGLLMTRDELCLRIGVPDLNPSGVFDQLWTYALHDKKNQNRVDTIEFVLMARSGHIAQGHGGQWTWPVDKTFALQAWHKLIAVLP